MSDAVIISGITGIVSILSLLLQLLINKRVTAVKADVIHGNAITIETKEKLTETTKNIDGKMDQLILREKEKSKEEGIEVGKAEEKAKNGPPKK